MYEIQINETLLLKDKTTLSFIEDLGKDFNVIELVGHIDRRFELATSADADFELRKVEVVDEGVLINVDLYADEMGDIDLALYYFDPTGEMESRPHSEA